MEKRTWIILFLTGILSSLMASEKGEATFDDPLLDELQKISDTQTPSPPSPTVKNRKEEDPRLADYRFDEKRWKIFSSVAEQELPLSGKNIEKKSTPHYLSRDEYRPDFPAERSFSPTQYLRLKKIVDPMPHRYAQTYLKMKTLLNPTRKYVRVHIDKSRQRMWVYLDNDYVGDWKVSTARRGYWTPVGVYRPYTLERMHYSRKYHNSPMPWSVFFKGGYAIHGTYSIRHLGRPASHGCVRVHPQNAKKLYQLIRRYGKQNTRIIIRG